ncbi:unnamed protein product [Ceratitis capitata]|uniref:(Mediterranean fruit fly) hypothetical protein n=1 Tax=Ceratitis capitata TaxID=7213 RepID=A0A811V1W7_CERCA|nr:unnamed protein product [Ceratitis capitata]
MNKGVCCSIHGASTALTSALTNTPVSHGLSLYKIVCATSSEAILHLRFVPFFSRAATKSDARAQIIFYRRQQSKRLVLDSFQMRTRAWIQHFR